jgi:hypothetical protein
MCTSSEAGKDLQYKYKIRKKSMLEIGDEWEEEVRSSF